MFKKIVFSLLALNFLVFAEEEGFSFVAFGDSRTLAKMPNKKEQMEDIYKSVLSMYEFVYEAKLPLDFVKQNALFSFDPVTQELLQIDMPFAIKQEILYLKLNKGWITEASVENLNILPRVRQPILHLYGGEWVMKEVVRNVQEGRAKFIVHGGDLVISGLEGHSIKDSPYWKRVSDLLLKPLPPPDAEMQKNNLFGRFFVAVGNHEMWGDPKLEGVLNAMPYLKKLGFSGDRPIYSYDFRGARFIFLWTGPFDYHEPSEWESTNPPYAEQMKQLKTWLDDAKEKGIKKVFINLHNPVFARSGFGGLPPNHNPHKLISSYAKDLEITVLMGHIHTTELYDVDGVKYLMLGNGGAEQPPDLLGHPQIPLPKDYPKELYWKDEARVEEYNYVIVDVAPNKSTKFTLYRFRPEQANAFESVELFK